MSNFTNYGENKILDKLRGDSPTYPSSWFFAFGSAADDGTFTELTGAALPRVALIRSTDNWAGTQAAGSTGASSGTSHTTSNNGDVHFSTASASFGAAATHIGLFDASTAGNCWIWSPLASPVTVNAGDSPTLAAGSIVFSLGLTGGCSDYLANKMIDEIFRGTAYAYEAVNYVCLFTTAPTNGGGGAELSGGGYERIPLYSNTDDLSASQGAGTTGSSSGTAGRISNNFSLIFPDPTANATIRAAGIKDAVSGGNLLFWQDFSAKSLSAGGAPATLSPDALGITID